MERVATARWTGLFYLGLAVAGVIGFLFVRDRLFVPEDASATLANLVEREGLARLGIAADLTIVLTQSLAALWFFKLFRRENSFAAGAITVFGMANALTILVATVFSTAALLVAGDAELAPGGDQAGVVQLLYQLNGQAWDLGGLFFGLWLIPMGFVVVTSRVMPVVLGWLLMAGGVGYVASAYLTQLISDAPGSLDLMLTVVADIGEFWMIGYLLIKGVRSVGKAEALPGSVKAA